MTEFNYSNPKSGEITTAKILTLSPYRLSQLAPIRKNYPDTAESILTIFEMAKIDPELTFVEGESKDKIKALIDNFKLGGASEETTKELLYSVVSKESRFDAVQERLNEAQEYLTVMCNFPKELKLNNEFWEMQNPKEVLRAGKFFRAEIENCFS